MLPDCNDVCGCSIFFCRESLCTCFPSPSHESAAVIPSRGDGSEGIFSCHHTHAIPATFLGSKSALMQHAVQFK